MNRDCRNEPGGGDGERESELNGELGTSSREEERALERGDESPDSRFSYILEGNASVEEGAQHVAKADQEGAGCRM